MDPEPLRIRVSLPTPPPPVDDMVEVLRWLEARNDAECTLNWRVREVAGLVFVRWLVRAGRVSEE